MIDALRTPFLAALNEHIRAIQARDLARFAATVTGGDDVRLIGPGGSQLIGREAILGAHRDWFASGAFTFRPRVVWHRETEEMGLALLDVEYADPGGMPTRFLLSLVFVREADGAFRLVYDQNTPGT